MSADRDRALERIKKCLNLAKSSEAHEAAAAMRQAQKLMAAFAVSEEEVLGLEVSATQVITPEPHKKSLPLYMNVLMSVCCSAFDCDALIEVGYKSGKARMAIRYFGLNGKDQLAAYAHEVMWRQMMEAWNEYRRYRPELFKERGARMGFWVGWLQEVRSKVHAFAGKEEEQALRQRAMIAYNGGKELDPAKDSPISLDGRTAAAGRKAAEDFSIHRPMNGETQRALKGPEK